MKFQKEIMPAIVEKKYFEKAMSCINFK